MLCRLAVLKDMKEVLDLQSKYHVDTILQEDKKDGFVTTAFTKENLEKLIREEKGLHVVEIKSKIVAYVMVASWDYWSNWPFFVHMIEHLHELSYLGQVLNKENSYQYGPICIDKSVRGQGVLEEIFEFSRKQMKDRYPILITFINKINPRSYAAHVNKLNLEVIHEFEYNNNQYDELVYDTSKAIRKPL